MSKDDSVQRKITTEEKVEMHISHDKLLEVLRQAYPEIPATAKISVRVPGGGDWSNTNLSLSETRLKVAFTNTDTRCTND